MAKRTTTAKRKPRAATRRTRPSWHTPSFIAGILFAAAGFTLVTQAPDYFSEGVAKLPTPSAVLGGDESEQLDFRFTDLLEGSEVPVHPERYGPAQPLISEPSEGTALEADERQPIYIQAASFRDLTDAESLRAQLILQGLAAATARVDLNSGAWYRVTVGPIDSATEAKKVMNNLRKQKLGAIQVDERQPIYIQAASFRDLTDAESLRAQLILQGLAAATARVDLNSGAWYRVTVGPIESAKEAKTVMNNLREQKLDAIWIKRS